VRGGSAIKLGCEAAAHSVVNVNHFWKGVKAKGRILARDACFLRGMSHFYKSIVLAFVTGRVVNGSVKHQPQLNAWLQPSGQTTPSLRVARGGAAAEGVVRSSEQYEARPNSSCW
jgi:hypothetical protein